MLRLASLEDELRKRVGTLKVHQHLHGNALNCSSRRGCGACLEAHHQAKLALRIKAANKKKRAHAIKDLDQQLTKNEAELQAKQAQINELKAKLQGFEAKLQGEASQAECAKPTEPCAKPTEP